MNMQSLPFQPRASLLQCDTVPKNAALELLLLIATHDNNAGVAQQMQLGFEQQRRIEQHRTTRPDSEQTPQKLPDYFGANSCVCDAVEDECWQRQRWAACVWRARWRSNLKEKL